MYELRSTADIVRLVEAGGGLTLVATQRPTEELALIAKAAYRGQADVLLRGLSLRPIEDLMMIAKAASGFVRFEE